VVALAIALLVLENNSGDVFGENITAALDLVLHWALAASLLYVAGRFLYEYLSLKTDAYWVKTGNLVVRRGVIIRKLGSFPLSRITDIYLAEDLLDVIFFLRNLQISTPSIESGPFAQIDGLSPGTATALRRELQELARVNRIFESTKTMEKPKEVGDLGMRDA